MNIFKIIWCRTYQFAMKIGMAFMPWRQPELIVGEGAFANLSSILPQKGVSHPLIVCDKSAIERHALDPLITCSNLTYSLYDGVLPNPTVDQVEEGLKIYNQNNCDGIVAFGGGSAMDCAKAIGARVVCPKKTVNQMKGLLKVGKRLPPFFAVPTTAGTGSECTVAAVITDGKTHDKYAINDFCLIPRYAVLDPLLTVGLPPFLTATTGMDALTHAVEAYIGKSNTKQTKKQAEQAVKLIFENIVTATKDGKNTQARTNMQKAAYLAGLAFTRAYVGYVHAMAHSLGGMYGTPHGLANAVLLPQVLTAFEKSAAKPLSKLATVIGIASKGDDKTVSAQKFINAVFSLNEQLGIPTKIDGICPSDLDALSVHAEREANPLYPVPKLMTKNDFVKIYKKVM